MKGTQKGPQGRPNICIRTASIGDAGAILGFIRELALYEKRADEARITEQDILKFLFERPIAWAILAHVGGQDAGFALYLQHFSTFAGKPTIYIEDLYVRDAYRRQGVGAALMCYLAAEAVRSGCTGIEWTVLNWNTPSMDFYAKLGARPKDGWTLYRLDQEKIQALAKGDNP